MDAPYHGVMCARMEFGFELQTEGASTMDITTIGFDLAKTVFQVHGADAKGRPALRRKLRRGKVLAFRNLSTTLRHRRFLFTDSFLLLWKWRVG